MLIPYGMNVLRIIERIFIYLNYSKLYYDDRYL